MFWLVAVAPLTAQNIEATSDTASPERDLAVLLGTPGLLTTVPSNDQPDAQARAKLFFEIGRVYYVLGDTVHAESALRYAHTLDPSLAIQKVQVEKKEIDLAQSFVTDLSLSQKRDRYARTSKVRAAGRSMVLPGWGQMYRGHRKRGLIALCTAAATGLFLAKAARDYNDAKRAYDATLVSELNLDTLTEVDAQSRPFESRYSAYQSKASTANVAVIALAAVWGIAVLDNLVLEPNRFELRLALGK
jgi:hypothetical protein